MTQAFLIEAVRTPVGRRGGGLSGAHPADLGAHVLSALVERTGVDPATVDDVIFGCVDAIGPQAGNIARTCWLAAGLPEEVPGVTVDRQCGSSQQAVHFAAQAVMSGTADLVVAGGVQNMSAVPISSAMTAGRPLGFADPFSGSAGWRRRYGDQEISQFRAAELIAAKWDLRRAEMEEFALESHRRAVAAIDAGRFAREIAPYAGVDTDEGPRRDTSLARMAGLAPLTEGGRVTAALASQIADGAAALLVASPRAVARHGLRRRARIHHLSVRAADPVYMLTGPIPATGYALARAGLRVADVDLVEINEAFAPVVLAWQRETGFDLDRVNVNGGAIALGHPLGATGVRLMTTMLHELERTGGRFGLQTMCEGGGTANVTIVERLEPSLAGRVALVTGGTRGIGRAIAARLRGAGAAVLVCARAEPAAALPDGVEFTAADVRDPDQAAGVVHEAVRRLGRLDIVVNNAGGSPAAPAATVSANLVTSVVRLNLLAPFFVAQAANAVMQEQDGGGLIINIGSVSAVRPAPGTAAYAAAKAGLAVLTQALAAEWAPAVRVNCVTAGLVRTEETAHHYGDERALAAVAATVPLGRMATPDDIADACLLLTSPLAGYVTGASLVVDGGGQRTAYANAARPAP